MNKRSSKRKKRDHEASVTAFRVVQEATADWDQSPAVEDKPLDTKGKNPNAVAIGRLGRKKGGKARAKKLASEQRCEITRKAAQTRWGSTRS